MVIVRVIVCAEGKASESLQMSSTDAVREREMAHCCGLTLWVTTVDHGTTYSTLYRCTHRFNCIIPFESSTVHFTLHSVH